MLGVSRDTRMEKCFLQGSHDFLAEYCRKNMSVRPVTGVVEHSSKPYRSIRQTT
jgi:hypothetical protein